MGPWILYQTKEERGRVCHPSRMEPVRTLVWVRRMAEDNLPMENGETANPSARVQ